MRVGKVCCRVYFRDFSKKSWPERQQPQLYSVQMPLYAVCCFAIGGKILWLDKPWLYRGGGGDDWRRSHNDVLLLFKNNQPKSGVWILQTTFIVDFITCNSKWSNIAVTNNNEIRPTLLGLSHETCCEYLESHLTCSYLLDYHTLHSQSENSRDFVDKRDYIKLYKELENLNGFELCGLCAFVLVLLEAKMKSTCISQNSLCIFSIKQCIIKL